MNLDVLMQVLSFIFGLIIGSFLNVCIVRLPHEKSIVVPRSHCVHCKKLIPWFDNIPVFSYLLLRGKCRHCGEKISPRYMIVEIFTGILFVLFYQYYGFTIILFPYLVMLCGLIVSTFVDFEHRIIPDEISVGGMCVGLVLSLFIPQLHISDYGHGYVFSDYMLSLWKSVVGVLVGGGSIYALGVLGDILFKKESMGGGDVKLMAMVGAFMGWKLALLAFFIAPFFGAVYGIVEKIRTKDSAIAYGPFLALGALISLFWGNSIIQWILQGYRIPY